MKTLTLDELEPLDAYAAQREQRLDSAAKARRIRRIQIGDRVALGFHNRDTIRSEIMEQRFLDHDLQGERLDEALARLNAVLPGHEELSATLTIEIPEALPRAETLERLLELDHPGVLVLLVGEDGVPATWSPGPSNGDPIPMRRNVRFALDSSTRRMMTSDGMFGFMIAHPNYRAIAQPSQRTIAALLADLDAP